jgi:putative addiction module killer protein
VEVVPQELREYVTVTGRNPFREWLHSLKDVRGRAMVRVRLNRLRLGNFGDCKSVGDGVYELRIAHGPGYRVYIGREGNAVVVLLSGGDKGSQTRDIAQAKEFWLDYKRRSS